MEILIFILLMGIIIYNAKKGKSSKSSRPRYKSRYYSQKGATPDLMTKLNAGQRAVQTGSATAAKYQHVRNKRRQAEMAANEGLCPSKDRQDKNRNRRTDWGARGDSGLFSPKMIGIIGGGVLTAYFALTALNI